MAEKVDEPSHFPMHQFCKNGDFDGVVRLIHACGRKNIRREVNRVNEGGWSPLFFAAAYGHLEVVKLLLRCEADFNAKSPYGETCFHAACGNGSESVVCLLLEKNPSMISMKTHQTGESPLYIASREGHAHLVKLLISKGAEVSEATPTGWTSLHIASNSGNLAAVKVLVEASPKVVLQQTHRGQVPLHFAKGKHLKVADYLRDQEHDVKVRIFAKGSCIVNFCICKEYSEGTRRHLCQCGHEPTDHCNTGSVPSDTL